MYEVIIKRIVKIAIFSLIFIITANLLKRKLQKKNPEIKMTEPGILAVAAIAGAVGTGLIFLLVRFI